MEYLDKWGKSGALFVDLSTDIWLSPAQSIINWVKCIWVQLPICKNHFKFSTQQ